MSRAAMTPSERYEYDRMRGMGYGAHAAWLSATRDRGGPDVPTDHGDTFERDGFILTVNITRDHLTPRDTGVGQFVSTWQDGCLDRKREGYHVGHGEHPLFLPDITQAEHEASGPNYISPEEARRYVLHDLDRAERFESEWWYTVIGVTAEREGIELGAEYLGGIETDCGERYKRQTINELADEAIHEAKEALERLCACGETEGGLG